MSKKKKLEWQDRWDQEVLYSDIGAQQILHRLAVELAMAIGFDVAKPEVWQDGAFLRGENEGEELALNLGSHEVIHIAVQGELLTWTVSVQLRKIWRELRLNPDWLPEKWRNSSRDPLRERMTVIENTTSERDKTSDKSDERFVSNGKLCFDRLNTKIEIVDHGKIVKIQQKKTCAVAEALILKTKFWDGELEKGTECGPLNHSDVAFSNWVFANEIARAIWEDAVPESQKKNLRTHIDKLRSHIFESKSDDILGVESRGTLKDLKYRFWVKTKN